MPDKKTFLRILSAIALSASLVLALPVASFANPDDAVPPSADGTVSIGGGKPASERDPDDNETGIAPDEQVRDEQGIVSQLSTDTHNPYNGQIRLDIDIGSEFAQFEGSNVTEGIRMKVTPGGILELPALRARDGYYFVGWGQGGVPYEPTWDPFVKEVEMSADTSEGKNTSIFALYADEEGNGYCTCGAYEQGIYADRLDEIKAVNAEYNETMGYDPLLDVIDWKVVALAVAIIACVAILVLAAWKDHKDGLAGDTEYL